MAGKVYRILKTAVRVMIKSCMEATILNTQGRMLGCVALRLRVWSPGSHRLRLMSGFAILLLV